MLEVTGLCKSFADNRVLEKIDLILPAGRITALLARNGAGKSTLVSLIAGRLRADAGEIRFRGESLTSAGTGESHRSIVRRIGVAPQDTGVYPDLTAIENLEFAGGCYGLRGRKLREAAGQALERLGLNATATKKARTLSGGQKRRLHTAMALVHEPELVLLDEPTVGSDPEARRYILDAVRGLANQGATVLYTSHYFPEIESLRADIAILNAGRILTHGPFDQITGGATNGKKNLEDIFFSVLEAEPA